MWVNFLLVQRNMYNQMYKLQKSRMIIEIPLPLYHNLHQFNMITIQYLNVILVNTVQSMIPGGINLKVLLMTFY
jgi:hypothetical protein